MKRIARTALIAVALVGIHGHARAADETVVGSLLMGFTGADIAEKMADEWSQVGDFDCSFNDNKLTVKDLSGDCDDPITRFKYEPDGGMLDEDHMMELRMQCSPNIVSINLDAAGFVVLSPGPNVFVSGADTITINLTFPTPPSIPTTPEWALIGLCVGAVLIGAWLLRRRQEPVLA